MDAGGRPACIYIVDMLDPVLESYLLGPGGVLASILEDPGITKVWHDAWEVRGWMGAEACVSRMMH